MSSGYTIRQHAEAILDRCSADCPCGDHADAQAIIDALDNAERYDDPDPHRLIPDPEPTS